MAENSDEILPKINWKSTKFENHFTHELDQKNSKLENQLNLKITFNMNLSFQNSNSQNQVKFENQLKHEVFSKKSFSHQLKLRKSLFEKPRFWRILKLFLKIVSSLCNLLEKPWFWRILEIFLKTVALAFFSKNPYFWRILVFFLPGRRS